jgi:tyrosine-protein kinase Etk/Wzc
MKKPKEIYFLNSLLNSSFIKKLNEKLVNLQLELLVISQQYQPSHPKIEMLLSQIEAIERKLNTLLTSAQKNLPEVQREVLSQYIQLKARLEILETKQQALSKIKAALNRQLASLLDNELEYVRLERRKEINKRIYTMLLEREQEARISETTTQPGAVIVDYPSLPTRPIAPNMKTNLILGAIMGIILGGFLIAGSEYLDTSVKNIEEVDRLLKCPILGFIPHTNSRARNSERPLQSKLLIHQSPSFKEAYETLQTNIKFIIPHNHHKRILITSAIPREGKSLTAVNLALVSASVGTPTAVLESDLRRAILHHTFEIDSKPGVTDFIIDKKIPLEAIIKPTRVKNLFLLPCGTPAPNPPELLSSPRMKEILERISLKFPTVVLDTPPVVAVIDAVVLGGLVDCVLVVVELGRTPVDQILHLKNAFKKANVAIKGVVVNNIRLNGYYAPYGGYLQYYRYYYTEKPPKGRRKRMSGIFKRLFTK